MKKTMAVFQMLALCQVFLTFHVTAIGMTTFSNTAPQEAKMAVAEIGVDGNVEVSTPTLEQITEAQVTQGENIEKTMGHQRGTARGARSVPSTKALKAALRAAKKLATIKSAKKKLLKASVKILTDARILTCEDSCAKAGHCCTGDTSSAQHPSCAMGCQAARHTGSVSECKATCLTNDNKCIWNLGGIPQDNCGECSGGCGLAEVQECLDGCEFGFGSSMYFRAPKTASGEEKSPAQKSQRFWNCKLSGR